MDGLRYMPISDKTRKILWGSSGNRCARCRIVMVIDPTSWDTELVVGEECHIISEKPNGPRYDPNYPAEKIDSVETLLPTGSKMLRSMAVVFIPYICTAR